MTYIPTLPGTHCPITETTYCHCAYCYRQYKEMRAKHDDMMKKMKDKEHDKTKRCRAIRRLRAY